MKYPFYSWDCEVPVFHSYRGQTHPFDPTLNEQVERALPKGAVDDFQTDLLVDKKCPSRLADYLNNSENFSLDECLNEAYHV